MANYLDPTTWRLKTAGLSAGTIVEGVVKGASTGIPYKLISQTGSFTTDGFSATEVYLIEATQLVAFVQESFALRTTFSGIPVDSRRPLPGNTQLVTGSVSYKAHIDGKPIDPYSIDTSAGSGTYHPVIELTIQYENLTAEEEDEEDPFTFLEISANASGEFLHITVPKARWETDDSGSPNTEQNREPSVPTGVTVPTIEWSIRWPSIPHEYFTKTLLIKLRDKLGKVNDSAMSVLFDAPKETIIFAGFSMNQQFVLASSQPNFSLELKFVEKHVKDEGVVKGHNHFWRPKDGWRRLRVFGTTKPVYELTDLDNIFTA